MNKPRFWRFRVIPLILVILHSILVIAIMLVIADDMARPFSPKESPMMWNLVILLDFPTSLVLIVVMESPLGSSLETFMGTDAYNTYFPGLSLFVLGGIQYWFIGTIVLWAATLIPGRQKGSGVN